MSDARQYATELLATAGRRPDNEPVMILAGRARTLANYVLETAEAPPQPKELDARTTVPVKNAREEAMKALEAAGKMKIGDLQQMLGQPNAGATKTMVKALVKAKKVTFNENTLEVALVA